jgi:hypothetical protein
VRVNTTQLSEKTTNNNLHINQRKLNKTKKNKRKK